MRHFLSTLPYEDKDACVVGQPDPLIVGASADAFGPGDHIFDMAGVPPAGDAAVTPPPGPKGGDTQAPERTPPKRKRNRGGGLGD